MRLLPALLPLLCLALPLQAETLSAEIGSKGLAVTEARLAALPAPTDAERLLRGTKLAPYWRQQGGAGVNIAKVFSDPRPADLAGWIQGWAAAPYLEKGALVSDRNWSAFEQMMAGEAMMLSFYLN